MSRKAYFVIFFVWIFGVLAIGCVHAVEKASISTPTDSFYDPSVDYSKFIGRVTDKDDTSSILKIISENLNIKFFRAGDKLEFTPIKGGKEKCVGYIRDSEKNYFVIYVKDLYPCWQEAKYFRRGTQLAFYSEMLADRVKEAAQFRMILLQRREDFFRQLNGINNFIWTYDQQRVLVSAEYDEKIAQIQDEKQKALSDLTKKKEDQLRVQRELRVKLDELDSDLEHYLVEKIELFADRWHEDQNVGAPVDNRPMEIKSE